MKQQRVYFAIDLKSFYASVECVERGLDPLTTNLVVADLSRTEKTICLAVTPSLKAYGIPGRARLFEVIQRLRDVNEQRRRASPMGMLAGASWDDRTLRETPDMEVSYLTAPPRMALYMEYSSRIYNIYLRYIAPEHIHPYSIDEVFIDATDYLSLYKLTPRALARRMIQDVLDETGVTATAGIGTNLYLCKVAMDIVAKHVPPDQDGVRIAELDEMSYRRLLWAHTPLTDFWRVGRGYAAKLEAHGLRTMGDIARCSLGKKTDYYNEDLLYQLFGVNAELLIDHAWGWESCTMDAVKAYRPESSSIGAGQVLHEPYTFPKARIIVQEMADMLSLELVDKGLVTDQIVLTIGYDVESLRDPALRAKYGGQIRTDHYGRTVPQHAHGTKHLGAYSSSTRQIMDAALEIYDRVVDWELLVRRVNITAGRVVPENSGAVQAPAEQLDLFTDYAAKREEELRLEREKRLQHTLVGLKKKFGKNAVLKGMNLQDGATARDRNRQIGGHRA